MEPNRYSEVLQRYAQPTQALCPTFWRFRALREARLRALFESDTAVPTEASPADCSVSEGFPASLGNCGDPEWHATLSDRRGAPKRQSGKHGNSKRHAALSDNCGDSRGISAFPDVRGDSGKHSAVPGVRGEPERHSVLSGCRGDSMELSVVSSGAVGDVASSLCHAGVASITVPSAIGMYLPGSCKAALARSASSACNVM